MEIHGICFPGPGIEKLPHLPVISANRRGDRKIQKVKLRKVENIEAYLRQKCNSVGNYRVESAFDFS